MFITAGELAVITASAAGVGAIGAMGGGWITGIFTTRASALQAVTARTLADEDRQQQRRRDAYITIQMYIVRWENATKWVAATGRKPDDKDMPPLPDTSEEAQAVASLMASDEVVGLVTKFGEAVDTFRNSYGSFVYQGDLNDHMEANQKQDLRPIFSTVQTAAKQVSQQAELVHKRLRAELRSATHPVQPA
jgi:hypothetical protein